LQHSKLLSPCRSVILPIKFGAPAVEELAVLDFIQHAATSYFTNDAAVLGSWETVFVATDRGAVRCQHCLTSFYVSNATLEGVRRYTIYRVSLSIFLTVFYVTPYLDSVMSAFIILQCFKTE